MVFVPTCCCERANCVWAAAKETCAKIEILHPIEKKEKLFLNISCARSKITLCSCSSYGMVYSFSCLLIFLAQIFLCAAISFVPFSNFCCRCARCWCWCVRKNTESTDLHTWNGERMHLEYGVFFCSELMMLAQIGSEIANSHCAAQHQTRVAFNCVENEWINLRFFFFCILHLVESALNRRQYF